MDVFKEFIDELKGENLLECDDINAEFTSWETTGAIVDDFGRPDYLESITERSPMEEANEAVPDPMGANDLPTVTLEEATTESVPTEPTATRKPSNGREFYKKRAIGELSHLQMVEHVLTGVEREYLKIIPKIFDDFAAKKALNTFLQVSEDENSPQHSQAEFAMMEETEAWCTALAERDRAIPVANLRQFCENSKPALSSQALVSLARFYRNVPYSESVRSKFDFVITRLFSRPAPGNKRICLFTREEMLNHLSLLYKEWSSIPLYAADDDESKVLLTALSFEELANEAENASSFDLLVANDFFGRLGMFKESVSELFFAPNVTSAAVECNIKVGNAYVTLIENERVKMDSKAIFAKFESVDHGTVSDAAARTLEIVDILRKQNDPPVSLPKTPTAVERVPVKPERSEPSRNPRDTFVSEPAAKTQRSSNRAVEKLLSLNRWLLGAAVLVLCISLCYLGWTAFFAPPPPPDTSTRTIELPNSVLRKHIKTARISGANFYGLLHPGWDQLPKEKREEFLKIVFDFAKEKGCSQVNLLDSEGNAAATVTASKIELKDQ